MSILLELLGKGLQTSLMRLVLPESRTLCAIEAALLEKESRETQHLGNLIRVGIHYAENGAVDKARGVFHSVLSVDAYHVEAHLALAALCIWEGSLDEALKILGRSYERHPQDARLLFAMGYCQERLGLCTEALPFYQQGAALRPYLRAIRERLAAIYVYQGKYEAGLSECTSLLREHPEDMWLYLAAGQLCLNQGQAKEAGRYFERALTIEPDNFELKDDAIEELVDNGRYEEAIEALQEVLARQGEFPDTYVRIGDLYLKLGNDPGAVTQYHKALELHPGYLEAAVKLGTQHLRQKRYYDAAVNFSRAAEINDQLITAYVGLAVSQQSSGYPEQARETVNLAASLDPNSNLLLAETCRLQLKIAMSRRGRDSLYEFDTQDKAGASADHLLEMQLQRHEAALASSGNRADLHYRYGMLLRGMGRVDEAIGHFRTALEINASYMKAKIKLGLSLREIGEPQEGMAHLSESLLVRPEYTTLHYKLGLLYCDQIRYALAVEHFSDEFQMGGEGGDIQSNLRLALQNMGLIDRVTALWQSVCELEPDSSMAFQSQRMVMPLKMAR